jgi:hypothetical protein
VLASAFIGAISYAFTDSFWFSAVEAEVYATSSLFTALVFWAILQYSSAPIGTVSYKWIVLIFFIFGLSVGIHLLNLLTLPAMVLVVYFKHYKASAKGILTALLLSGFMLLLFINGIIPGIAKLAATFDLVFVNGFGLPVYSGALFFVLLVSSTLYLCFQFFKKKKNLVNQLVVLSFTFWLIGYSSFAILVIRSTQNPFVDINNVQNIYGLVDYLNREQYPARPLIYGNNYNSPIVETQKRYTYKLHKGTYVKDELNPKYIFDNKTLSLFPRMASMDEAHVNAYKQWVSITGRKVKTRNQQGELETFTIPTFKENVQFFIRYQLGYMYGRYFMWNFAGKQNDIQGHGDIMNGNWLSGISALDNVRLGNQQKLPDYYKNHKARNIYFMLPLLLGLFGIVYQYRKDKSNFWVNVALFFFTGIAIVLYLNEVPITPRERDYVHVGSFYVFALWIGLGALGILQGIAKYSTRYINNQETDGNSKLALKLTKPILILVSLIILSAVPLNLLIQNWDDHNRSNRYTAREYAKNMLKSCEKNAVFFTTADNDTYPIWYLQEVEQYRTEVRNVLLTFLPVDWYADQLNQEFGERGRIPISFKSDELLMSENQYFPVFTKTDSFMDVGKVIDFVKNKSEKTQIRTSDNRLLSFIPGTHLELKVNAEKFLKTCPYLQGSKVEVPASIKFTITKSYLSREDLLLLDILENNNWERPLYFIYPHLVDNLGLSEYLHREGMLYRFMPMKQNELLAFVKSRSLHQYNLMQQEFDWGNLEKCDVHLDFTNVQMTGSFRIHQALIETANLLITANENIKAIEILDLAQTLLPPERVPYSWFMPDMVRSYQWAGAFEKANELLLKVENKMQARYSYSQSLKGKISNSYMENETLYIMQQLVELKGKNVVE